MKIICTNNATKQSLVFVRLGKNGASKICGYYVNIFDLFSAHILWRLQKRYFTFSVRNLNILLLQKERKKFHQIQSDKVTK